jgi:hypothetical protein
MPLGGICVQRIGDGTHDGQPGVARVSEPVDAAHLLKAVPHTGHRLLDGARYHRAQRGDRLGVLGECIRDGGVDTSGSASASEADCTSLIVSLLDDMSLVGSACSGASVVDARARLPCCALRAIGAQPTHPRR